MPDNDETRESMAKPRPDTLSRSDAITEADGLVESRKWKNFYEALTSFHRAPCLKPSLGAGALGGLGIGVLRYMGGAGSKAAFTWGSTVAGLLAGTSWFTCRRAMYSQMKVNDESALIERMHAGDREALKEYHRILEERAAKDAAAAHDDGARGGSGWYRKG